MSQTLSNSVAKLNEDDVQAIDRLRAAYQRLSQELSRVIVGQKEVIEQLAICLFARRHACSWEYQG